MGDEFDGIPKPPAVHERFPDMALLTHIDRIAAEGEDCLAMCLAFITGIQRSAIPNFVAFGENVWWEKLNAWLDSWGLKLVDAVDDGDTGHVICVGNDSGGVYHAVVHVGGCLAYDSYPASGGIENIEFRWRVVIDE